MVEKLDPKLKPFVRQELKKLGESMRSVHASQNKTYWDTTQEKWGPGGSKAKGAAGKKKFSQKATEEKTLADKKSENSKTEDKESSEKPASAETDGANDAETEKNPDVKSEQRNKEPESGRASGEGLDNENMEGVAVREDEQGAADNRATDKDSEPAPTSTGKDNVASKRSASDKAKKVKRQSGAAPGPSRTSKGSKATGEKTGNGGTQSGQTNRGQSQRNAGQAEARETKRERNGKEQQYGGRE